MGAQEDVGGLQQGTGEAGWRRKAPSWPRRALLSGSIAGIFFSGDVVLCENVSLATEAKVTRRQRAPGHSLYVVLWRKHAERVLVDQSQVAYVSTGNSLRNTAKSFPSVAHFLGHHPLEPHFGQHLNVMAPFALCAIY